MAEKKVTPEDVRWAYRLLLLREPESETAILDKINLYSSVDKMMDEMIKCEEYLSRRRKVSQSDA